MERFVQELVERARSVVDAGRTRPVASDAIEPLHAPTFDGQALSYVTECVETGWVSSAGRFVDRFEDELENLTGMPSVAVVNGTCALEIALRTAGVGPGDLVACPSLSFIASANAIAHAGARPVFVDVEPRRLGICPEGLEQTLAKDWGAPIRAVVAVSVFGHPFDVERVVEVCSRAGVPLVEDAAEALGSLYAKRHMGGFGKLGILSFNGNKLVTTGGGGAVVTPDDELARHIKHVTTTAKLAHPWEYHHDQVGYNYRLPNINAALGCAQLEQLPGLLADKRRLAERYREALSDLAGAQVLWEPAKARSNFWLNGVILAPEELELSGDDELMELRARTLEALNDAGLQSRPIWHPLHLQRPFSDCPRGPLPVAEDLGRRIINLPSSAALGRLQSPAATAR